MNNYLNKLQGSGKLMLEPVVNHARENLKLCVIGSGDVARTMILGLLLTASDGQIQEINILGPDETEIKRLIHEFSQVYRLNRPVISIISDPLKKRQADAIIFCASASVPPISVTSGDVRLVQFQKNSKILGSVVDPNYKGLYLIVSDPVDLLCDYLVNKHKVSHLSVIGFGQGVMKARAVYHGSQRAEIFGPHGENLLVINDLHNYSQEESLCIQEACIHDNLVLRKLGYKPYIAPAISSAAFSILDFFLGNWHYATYCRNDIFFGGKFKNIEQGLYINKIEDHRVVDKIKEHYQIQKEMSNRIVGK